MKTTILINDNFYEIKVACLKNGEFWEYFQEKKQEKTLVGNIYKGKVLRVLPGLQSAFIDIGYEKAAFLHVNDLLEQHLNYERDGDQVESDQLDISQMLSDGDEIIVQVVKDPISTKGPRVTTWISIPGRFLVFFPIGNKVGVSKRIEQERERKRLKDIVEMIKPHDTTFIIRTAAEGVSKDTINNDMNLTMRVWIDIVEKQKGVKAPFILYEDLSLALKVSRDLLNQDVDEMLIDNGETYKRISNFIDYFMPSQKGKIKLYSDKENILTKHGLDKKIESLFKRSVPLKSGGNIIIEQVEAMTIIDVNTGSFIGKNLDHSDTILQTNKEAMFVLAEQIRLRNIGGIIIVDFIDMKSEAHKDSLLKYAEEVTVEDRGRVTIHSITSLGLMQITRKRISESIKRTSMVDCPVCEGSGYIKSPTTVTHSIYGDILKYDKESIEGKKIEITVSESVLTYIQKHEDENIKILKNSTKAEIEFTVSKNLHPTSYRIVIL